MAGAPSEGCSICGKAAFTLAGSPGAARVPICVEHYIQLQGVENERQRNLIDHSRHAMAMNNSAIDLMDAIVGFSSPGGRIRIPDPTPVGKYTSVNVANSTVGVVSTEAVGEITAHVGAMPQHDPAKGALERLTAAVVEAGGLDQALRLAMLDQISVVSAQAAAEPPKRKGAAVAPLLATIGQSAATVTALANVWTAVEPILKAHFKLP